MTIPSELLELGEWFQTGYKPVLDFHGWRVAMLRYIDDVDVDNFKQVERHRNTNEVFILSEGTADLILFSGGDSPEDGYVIPMKQSLAYNIPDYVWHHVIMSKDAHIILFERTETGPDTSDYAQLNQAQLSSIKEKLRFTAS